MGRRTKFGHLFSFVLLTFFSFPFVSAATPISDTPITLPLFLVIAGICLFCLLIGLGAGIPFFTIIGFFIVFVLGFVVQGGNLMIPNGELETSYVYAGGNLTDTVEVVGYTTWDYGNNHLIGFFLMMAGLFATFFSVFATFTGGND